MAPQSLKSFLDEKATCYNQQSFIENDPISIPHRFTIKQDIEISAFWIAMLAWGQRTTIINKGLELMDLMDQAPYDFVRNHKEADLKRFLDFKHRTFNVTDTLYFLHFLKNYYNEYDSLEDAFLGPQGRFDDMEKSLTHFHKLFFDLPEAPQRTRKHVATPQRKSACKRINMFLRWMVRQDTSGVDFGIWQRIHPKDLVCPCDLHVDRVARNLGLIERKATDWATAIELTKNLKKLDPQDPVKYDFALFGLGIVEQFGR
ncbi:MAG: TIGR02757 family protein [Cyclobacteriaceae bacterium]